MHSKVIVALLAGGQSRRMGHDKAQLKVGEQTILEKVAGSAIAAGLPVWIIGRTADDPCVSAIKDITAIPDEIPGCGPLGGLATALRYAGEGADILLAACDLPLVKPEDFQWLVSLASADGTASADGIVPTWRGKPEPFFAIYRQTLLPMVDRHIKMQRLAMQDLIATGAFVHVPLPEAHLSAIEDADTPEQYKDLLRGF